MIISALYVLLAIFGLSFLIFIHELGHYWMARRMGMRVEVFAIGFGRPIYAWERDGVMWQIGWLLFGGYVKIAGMETQENIDPYQVKDGFFAKSPWARLKVAFMGPFVNLLFALVAFTLLWSTGGREKNFSEFTHKIGWIDPKSELYAAGVRPGDEVLEYDGYPLQSYKDHLYAAMMASGPVLVKGTKINDYTGEKTPFEYFVEPYANPSSFDKSVQTLGVLNSASYILYGKLPNEKENPLPEGSPLQGSGIAYGDRIIWADGQLIHSLTQLNKLLNDERLLLTIKRDGNILQKRVPRVLVQNLRPHAEFKEEILDWQHEAGINDKKLKDVYTIPYNLTHDCVVEQPLRFIDRADQDKAFPEHPFGKEDGPLLPGDRIIASQGTPITHSFELLRDIQERHVHVIVERGHLDPHLSWKDGDAAFFGKTNMGDLQAIVKTIGSQAITAKGDLILLQPVTPKRRLDFMLSEEAKALLEAERIAQQKMLEETEDPEKKRHLMKTFEASEKALVLGLPLPQDRKIVYNPLPTQMFINVVREIWRTLEALLSGGLSPKYISGPVGIVQMVHDTSMVSLKEALFWLGAISLNLGILNLLPVPVLDGGMILFSGWEMLSGRKLHPKTMERVMIFFAVLLISFFLFLTYNDLLRIFGRFFY